MSIVAFNGFLFSQRQTGTMRYAREILKELDKLVHKGEYYLIVPVYTNNLPELENIKIIKFGRTKGSLWEQVDYLRYLRKTGTIQFNFNNTFPILKPGMLAIYDIAYKLHPEFGVSLHGKVSNIYHRIVFYITAKKTFPIVTDSFFSKYQLIDEYKIDPHRITVIGSAWQHFDEIEADYSILIDKGLQNGSFYFTLASLSIMKNTKWILEVARKHPQEIFVLTGAKSNADKENFLEIPNVIYTGYICDEKIKALMKSCKAFVYASIYDGFGLPPLEALSQGARVICSNAACLPEIYGNSVHYIDPYNTDIDLERLIEEPVDPPESVLRKYSWKKSARKFYELLQNEKNRRNSKETIE